MASSSHSEPESISVEDDEASESEEEPWLFAFPACIANAMHVYNIRTCCVLHIACREIDTCEAVDPTYFRITWPVWPPHCEAYVYDHACMHVCRSLHLQIICKARVLTMRENKKIILFTKRDCSLCFTPWYAWKVTCVVACMNQMHGHEWHECCPLNLGTANLLELWETQTKELIDGLFHHILRRPNTKLVHSQPNCCSISSQLALATYIINLYHACMHSFIVSNPLYACKRLRVSFLEVTWIRLHLAPRAFKDSSLAQAVAKTAACSKKAMIYIDLKYKRFPAKCCNQIGRIRCMHRHTHMHKNMQSQWMHHAWGALVFKAPEHKNNKSMHACMHMHVQCMYVVSLAKNGGKDIGCDPSCPLQTSHACMTQL